MVWFIWGRTNKTYSYFLKIVAYRKALGHSIMYKKLVYLIILMTVTINLFGQAKTNNVYELALIRLVETVTSKYSCLIKNDTLIIWGDRYISSKLPHKIKGINMVYADFQSKYPIRNNDSAFIIFMSPIVTLYNNKLGIEFDLWKDFVTDSGDICTHGCPGDGGEMTIIFDCKKKKYIIGNFDFTLSDCECEK